MSFSRRDSTGNGRGKRESNGVIEFIVRGFGTQVVVTRRNAERFGSRRSRGARRGRHTMQEGLEDGLIYSYEGCGFLGCHPHHPGHVCDHGIIGSIFIVLNKLGSRAGS